MKKQTNVETLEGEIAAAQSELDACQASVERQNAEIRQAVMKGQPETEIDALQTARDATTRQAERLRLKVDALEAKRPEAARKDAEAALPGLVKGITDRLAHLQDTYTGLEKAWDAVLDVVATCEKAQAEAETILEDHAKIRLLAMDNGLTVPEVPVLPIFSQDVVRSEHYERARGVAYWQPQRARFVRLAAEQATLIQQREALDTPRAA